MSRGTAMSTINMGECLRFLKALSTAPLPNMGNGLAVEAITISALYSSSGMSDNKIALAPN